jgi:pimeloyl-ACP methyl ester carboxylesterase
MELAHVRSGAGPALVLIHGITESHSTWDPVVETLSEHFDVVAVDLRGHGDSPRGDMRDPARLAADVHETVDGAGMVAPGGAGPIVIGHSLGGVVATFYGAAYGTRGIVNVDQPLRLGGFKAALSQLEPMLRGDEDSFQQALGMIFSALAGALPAAEAERVQSIRRPRQDDVLGIWSTVLESEPDQLDARMEQVLGTIRVPYLAIHGGDLEPGYEDWLRRVLPTATVDVWPGVGHYPHLVDPLRFVARVREFATAL